MKDANSAEKLDKFMNEIRILSLCDHPNVIQLKSVSIMGTFITSGSQKRTIVYHVSNYAKYGELYKIIQEIGGLPEKIARVWFIQLLNALNYLHSIGICHRDLKPENLLIDDKLNLLIADFGSAAKCRTIDNKIIEFDSIIAVGSQEYNAPEVNMEKTYFGEKADLFSLTVCLFYMIFGQSPFRAAHDCDSYYKLLTRSNKAKYWQIYTNCHISSDFKGIYAV